MTHDLRWRARVLVEADRTSMSAAATRNGCSAKAIADWRKQLTADPELAGYYARETQIAIASFRGDLSSTLSAALNRMRELIPSAGVEDMTVLLSVARDCGELLVQADALIPQQKDPSDASPVDRGRAAGSEDPESDRGDPRH